MEHQHSYPEALETLLSRLPELRLVLGPQATRGLEAVERLLQQAIALRADGDVPRAVSQIAAAMDRLSQLADGLGPQDAALMRMLSEQFRRALLGGHDGEARQLSELMREKSGTTVRK